MIGHKGTTRKQPRPTRIITVDSPKNCPIHLTELVDKKHTSKHIITDLVFSKNGVRKTVIKYIFHKAYCKKCVKSYQSEKVKKVMNKFFGHNFKIWIVYQRLYLRLPHRIIKEFTNIQFNETISNGSTPLFIKQIAKYYTNTEELLHEKIKQSAFVHVDETQINIKGLNHYVWIFTDGKHVVFRLTPTREPDIVFEILGDYQGVLITDFYPGYDAMPCKQQKCLVHLLRDMNDDLWRNPFDGEYETFVSNFRDLILPIFQTIQRFGLKKYHFNKFLKKIDTFYQKKLVKNTYQSELSQKYQKRMLKYWYALFTFMSDDNIPWNNNMGERGIRHLAVQRKISGYFSKNGAEDYLKLLGVMQSCRFQNKCFLKFMISKQIDIDKFKSK